jgi:hypothetical protein
MTWAQLVQHRRTECLYQQQQQQKLKANSPNSESVTMTESVIVRKISAMDPLRSAELARRILEKWKAEQNKDIDELAAIAQRELNSEKKKKKKKENKVKKKNEKKEKGKKKEKEANHRDLCIDAHGLQRPKLSKRYFPHIKPSPRQAERTTLDQMRMHVS